MKIREYGMVKRDAHFAVNILVTQASALSVMSIDIILALVVVLIVKKNAEGLSRQQLVLLRLSLGQARHRLQIPADQSRLQYPQIPADHSRRPAQLQHQRLPLRLQHQQLPLLSLSQAVHRLQHLQGGL